MIPSFYRGGDWGIMHLRDTSNAKHLEGSRSRSKLFVSLTPKVRFFSLPSGFLPHTLPLCIRSSWSPAEEREVVLFRSSPFKTSQMSKVRPAWDTKLHKGIFPIQKIIKGNESWQITVMRGETIQMGKSMNIPLCASLGTFAGETNEPVCAWMMLR